jgi:hypothetical protein
MGARASGRVLHHIDTIEQVFEHGRVTAAPAIDLRSEVRPRNAEEVALLQKVRDLQQRVRQVEGANSAPTLETVPALGDLLPHGGLRPGASYAVGSTSLAMALLAGPSTAGTWCGVIGAPEFGAEAATALGVDLSRVVFVPDPGYRWVTVAAAMIDVLGLVLVKPPGPVHQGEAARLSARLRQRGSTLLAMGSWPQAEARLTILDNTWIGLGDGFGHLNARIATVSVDSRGGRVRTGRLWLPGADAQVRPVEPAGAIDPIQSDMVRSDMVRSDIRAVS